MCLDERQKKLEEKTRSFVCLRETLGVVVFYIMNISIYLILLGIYARVVARPMFFPMSCVLAVAVPVVAYLFFRNQLKAIKDTLARKLMVFSTMLIIIVFAVFGPTFIDRSISYHLAFIAVEQGQLNKQVLESSGYVSMVFDKRYEDACITGFIEQTKHGDVYVPTFKAKVMYNIMMVLGKITGSLGEYDSLNKSMDMAKRGYMINE